MSSRRPWCCWAAVKRRKFLYILAFFWFLCGFYISSMSTSGARLMSSLSVKNSFGTISAHQLSTTNISSTNRAVTMIINSRVQNRTMFDRNVRHLQLLQRARMKENQGNIFKPYKTTTPSPEIQKLQDDYYKLSNKTVVPIDSRYIINNERICRNNSVQMLIFVPSVPSHVEARKAIRYTYGQLSKDKVVHINGLSVDFVVRNVFILGRSPNESVAELVRQESNAFKDIVAIDFVDSYYNLTLKVLHGLKWADKFCGKVQYVVKIDEDVFLNTAELIRQLKFYDANGTEAVFGTVFRKLLTVQRTGKWAVSYEQFPLQQYPAYSQGNCYTLSGSLSGKIVNIARHLPYLQIEDAFVTGVVAGKFLNSKMIKIHGNSNWKDDDYVPDPCDFVKYKYVSTTNMTPFLMYKTWSALKSYKTKCVFWRPLDKKLNNTMKARKD